LEFKITDSEASYVLEAQTLLPAHVMRTYDEYLTREQNKGNDLQDLNTVLERIGPWLIGNCAESDKQAWCMEQFLGTCGTNLVALDLCVTGAYAAWCSKNPAECASKASEDAANAAAGAAQATTDAIGGAISCIFGCPEQKPAE